MGCVRRVAGRDKGDGIMMRNRLDLKGCLLRMMRLEDLVENDQCTIAIA